MTPRESPDSIGAEHALALWRRPDNLVLPRFMDLVGPGSALAWPGPSSRHVGRVLVPVGGRRPAEERERIERVPAENVREARVAGAEPEIGAWRAVDADAVRAHVPLPVGGGGVERRDLDRRAGVGAGEPLGIGGRRARRV